MLIGARNPMVCPIHVSGLGLDSRGPPIQAFTVAYIISIWFQHILHSQLVYGWGDSYWKGLVACYTGYSFALVASVQ